MKNPLGWFSIVYTNSETESIQAYCYYIDQYYTAWFETKPGRWLRAWAVRDVRYIGVNKLGFLRSL